ncbi:MAG: HEAT repeat domain-containing protein [Polyangiaceae bacterium]|nr:HEAT repeat domain-containing protein [Polyangiaceae bacterium]
MNLQDQIGKLLDSPSMEHRIAAAVVIGELKLKSERIHASLSTALDSGIPPLQRQALLALSRVGAKKALPKIFPLTLSSDEEVRGAARTAILSVGETVVGDVKKRLLSATPEERRALDRILADLGGKDAFTMLLSGLEARDPEEAKAAALAVRAKIKDAGGQEKRSYLAQVEKILERFKKTGTSESSIATVLKILGYFEDERTLPVILPYVRDKKVHSVIRQEAMIALRFALGQTRKAPKVVDVLLDLALGDDRMIATTALHTLGSLEIPAATMEKLGRLIDHAEIERARFVMEMLSRQNDEAAAKMLVRTIKIAEKARAEIAGAALVANKHAGVLLAKALLETKNTDRAWLIRNVLRPFAKELPKALQKSVLEEAIRRLSKGERGFEPYLDVARDADPETTLSEVRAAAQKLRKTQPERALAMFGILCRSEKATSDDRFAYSILGLGKGFRDLSKEARNTNEPLRQLMLLARKGFDVTKALRKEKAITLEDLYTVGFHFVEDGISAGGDLLEEVVNKGGRAKIAKMAKNKLQLSERE